MNSSLNVNSSELRNLFIHAIEDNPAVQILQADDVLHIRFDGEEMWLYFKRITHEGNPHPEDNYRAQLPNSPIFDKVIQSSAVFFFLGYDVENDVFVTWEPDKIKPRLNTKSNISLYSRLSVQRTISSGTIQKHYLTNGDAYVLFKTEDAILFLERYTHYFPKTKNILFDLNNTEQPQQEITTDIIRQNKQIVDIIDSALLEDKSTLEIMQLIGEFFVDWELTDLYELIQKYVDEEWEPDIIKDTPQIPTIEPNFLVPTELLGNKRDILRVTFPNRMVICGRSAKETFIKTIELIGVEKVHQSGIMASNYLLVDRIYYPEKKSQLSQYKLNDGWWLTTNIPNDYKVRHLTKLSSLYNLNLNVELLSSTGELLLSSLTIDTELPTGKDTLEVTFPDGTVVHCRNAKDTFVKAIEKIGAEKVYRLNIISCNQPLVNTQYHYNGRCKIAQEEIPGGWWIVTQLSNEYKVKFLKQISDYYKLDLRVRLLTPNGEEKSAERTPRESTRRRTPVEQPVTESKKDLLEVIFPDGEIIKTPVVRETFAKALRKIGFEKVSKLGLTCRYIPLVSTTPYQGDTEIPQIEIDGWWVVTHSSTIHKANYLKQISNFYQLNLIVNIIPASKLTSSKKIEKQTTEYIPQVIASDKFYPLAKGYVSIDNSLSIIDEDRLCFLVESKNNSAFGWRTISKPLVLEFVEYFKNNPNDNAASARDALSGKTNIDKYEYGYGATLAKMAKIILGIEK